MQVKAWSKSSLSTLLEGCSWSWALEKLYGLESSGSPATAMGTAYHYALEQHERRRILHVRDGVGPGGMSLDEMAALAHPILHKEAAELPAEQWAVHDTSPHQLAAQLEDALANWWSAQLPEGQLGAGGSLRDRLLSMRPVAVEPYFNVPAFSSRMHGFIDWLGYDHETKTWVVADHKTANGLSRWPVGGAGHEIEASVYVVGSQLAKHLPTSGAVRMEWHIARKEIGTTARFQPVRNVSMRVEPIHEDHLGRQLAIADEIVSEEAFTPNPAWNLCSAKWCAFYEGCQVTGELAPGGKSLPLIRP